MADGARWIPFGVISGGQTGVDRGGLDAAIACGIPVGGWVPEGRRAEDGRIPDKYPMWKVKGDRGWAPRTRANVVTAAATLILSRGPPTRGTRFTLNECLAANKPHLVVDLNDGDEVNVCKIRKWLDDLRPNTVNIAGPREKRMPGIHAQTVRLLMAVFSGDSSSLTTNL